MKVAIVNDMPMAIEGLKRVVQSTGDYEVIWTAWDGVEAVERCSIEVPDLILMDLVMPKMNGVEATARIMQSTPCPIMVVTASVNENSSMVFEAMGKGALDAVNTPLLIGQAGDIEKAALLRKMSMLKVLTKSFLSVKSKRSVSAGRTERVRSREHLVAIGASSGGPQALATLLKDIPSDFNAAIIIVQHVDVQFSQGLADWLNQKANLPVRLAVKGDRPTPGKILLAGSNDHLVLSRNGTLNYQQEPIDMPYRPSVDVFWQSLHRNWQGELSAVLLTGMGRDGAEAMLELRNSGVYTMAQDEASCAVYGMPKAAAKLNAAVDVKTIQNMVKALIERHG
jgi:two-component system response regulator WspF